MDIANMHLFRHTNSGYPYAESAQFCLLARRATLRIRHVG